MNYIVKSILLFSAIYDGVDPLLPFVEDGWYQNGPQIEILFESRPIHTVVEVGCWLGLSTRHIASLVGPEGRVYAVDHWLGSEEHQPGEAHWHPALDHLYEQFLSNVIHAGLQEIIVPIRMPSLEAAQLGLFQEVDLIYIDASHETEDVYRDLVAWFPYVEGHGILCGDDWGWESVQRAVKRFAKEKKLSIYHFINFWRLVE